MCALVRVYVRARVRILSFSFLRARACACACSCARKFYDWRIIMDEVFPAAVRMIEQNVAQNNSWSAEQAMKQMQFQERMSNTAFQRQVADLKASGLNPVLSARLGGASTPSGASASADTSGTSALGSLLTELMRQTAEASAAGAASGSARGYLSAITSEDEGQDNTISYLSKNGVGTSGLAGNPAFKLDSLGKVVYQTGKDLGGVTGSVLKASGNILQKLSSPYEKYVVPVLSKAAGALIKTGRSAKGISSRVSNYVLK